MSLTLDQATAALTARGAPFEMVEVVIDGVPLRCWKNVPGTLRELVLQSRAHGARTYLVYEDERLSYEEAFQRIAALARYLVQDFGIRRGDRIAIAMRNYPEWVLCFWAAACAGAVLVPLNAWWTGEELAFGLSDSGARLLFADEERAQRISPYRDQLALEAVIVSRFAEAPPPGCRPLAPLFDALDPAASLPEVAIAPDDDATIFYTSGTTGKPKGALGTQRNMMTAVGSVQFARACAGLRKGKSIAQAKDAPQQTTLVSVPLFHVTGSHSILAYGTNLGAKFVLMYRFTPELALELIEREHVTHFGGVPAVAFQILESPAIDRYDLSSVVGINYGGAPAAPELVRRLKQRFPEAMASNGYGLTETSAGTASNTGIDYEARPESVGRPLPICDVRVVGEDGRDLPAGAIGELWIRGPNVVRGYYRDPEATAQSFVDGWLRTGDLVRLDQEGFIYVLDRAKDMLIRGGENIYCVEVENALYQHPEVMDAAVIGIPHRMLGEEVGAVVQLVPGARASADELRAHVAKHLAAFKVPVRIELRHDPLPRNANGKILKRQLKRELGLE